MEKFNRLLVELKDFQVDLSIDSRGKNIREDLEETNAEEADAVLEEFNKPLDPPIYNLVIYYPISDGLFAPIRREYRSTNPVIPTDIFDVISAFYETKLNQDYIDAYLSTGKYEYLRTPIYKSFGIKFYDLVKNKYISQLNPYQEGYLLQLESP